MMDFYHAHTQLEAKVTCCYMCLNHLSPECTCTHVFYTQLYLMIILQEACLCYMPRWRNCTCNEPWL